MDRRQAAAGSAAGGIEAIAAPTIAAESDFAETDRPTDDAGEHRSRGEPLAALVGARTAEPIVSAIESDDRYPGIARREATDVAESRCRHCVSATCSGRWIESKRGDGHDRIIDAGRDSGAHRRRGFALQPARVGGGSWGGIALGVC